MKQQVYSWIHLLKYVYAYLSCMMNMIVLFYFKEWLRALEGNFEEYLVHFIHFQMQELSLKESKLHTKGQQREH